MATDSTPVKPALIVLNPEQVERVFAEAQDQADYVIGLYTLVFPDFAQIAKIDGFPTCGPVLSEAIWHQAIAFDGLHHPDVMAGGCWMNHGFSTDNALPDWAVLPCPVTYRKEDDG